LPYGYSHGLRRLSGDRAPMSDDERASHAALLAEYRAREDEYAGRDEIPEEVDSKLEELEQAMEAIEARPLIFDPDEVTRAGAFVTLDRSGQLSVYRGYVRPEDEPRAETAVQDGSEAGATQMGQGGETGFSCPDYHGSDASAHIGTIITSGGQPLGAGLPEDEADGALKPLPERLVQELTAHRTLALREALGRSPDVALTLRRWGRRRYVPQRGGGVWWLSRGLGPAYLFTSASA